ncbi:MAG: nucleotidyltransferase family protein [Myxococcota bacterium]
MTMKDWKNCVVGPQATIREAMTALDAAGLQIGLLLEADGTLVGALTDGDVRRALLRGKGMDEPALDIANRSPIVVNQNTSQEDVVEVMRRHSIHHVLVIDAERRVQGLEFLAEALDPGPLPNRVVLMAGGLGSRLAPLTDTVPKPMLKVGDRPILQTIIESFRTAGFRRFSISVNYQREQIKTHFGDGAALGVDIGYLEENERLGTAGALGLLPQAPRAPIFLMNGDILTRVNFRQMLRFHQSRGAAATMAVREFPMQVPYGVVEQENARVTRIVEKPVHRVFVNAGIYILEPSVVARVPAGQALDMPTLLERVIAADEAVCSFPVHEYWLDIGRKDDFQRAHDEYHEVFP